MKTLVWAMSDELMLVWMLGVALFGVMWFVLVDVFKKKK